MLAPLRSGIKPYEEGDVEDYFTLKVENVGTYLA